MIENNFWIVALVIFSALLIGMLAIMKSDKRRDQDEFKRAKEMIREARMMFPGSENDVVSLDKFYQHKFRELVLAKTKGEDIELLQRDCMLIFNEKNKVLKHIVEFETGCYKIINNHN